MITAILSALTDVGIVALALYALYLAYDQIFGRRDP